MKTASALLLAVAAFSLALSCAGAPKSPELPAEAPTEAPADAQSGASESWDEAPAAPAAAPQATPAAAPEAEAEAEPAIDPVAAAFAAAQYASTVLDPLEAYAGASEGCAQAIDAALGLAIAGKWKSAYDGLAAYDPKADDPYALAMMIDLVLGGALRSDTHLSFALKDLEAGESIDGLRQTEGEYPMFAFDPAALAEAQAAAGRAVPAVLSRHLGNYFYDLRSYFAGEWRQPDEEVAAKCLELYAAAYAAGSFDLVSLGRQIELLTEQGRAAETEPLFRASIALSPADPQLRFNLAQAILAQGKKAEGMQALDEAIAAYGESPERFQAMAMAASKAAELGDLPAYERYLSALEAAMPDNPTPDLLRHMIAVERGWDAKADAIADGLAARSSSPQIVRTLVSTWYNAGKAASARAFLDRGIASLAGEESKAAFRFYLAVLIAQEPASEADRAAALAALDAAEAYFAKAELPEEGVLEAIAEIRAGLRSPAPEQPAAPPVP
ncbi:MAG TPA: hypothetical protein P5133_06040 [Spirochaetia bacterium]|nr:hypothetical protein [Spirochaetia bacterium]HRZ64473.1 hypothetical protein [Spirochaetia bacterium]